MNNTPIDKSIFINTASDFFNEIFEPAFNSQYGNIEIRTFPKGQAPQQYFFESETEAAEKAYQLCQQGIDVYFGVNPRIGNGGKKENVQFLSAFHAEIDYGILGHKKPPLHKTYEEALNVIQAFSLEPTIIIHSGGGFHCYWVLSNPIKVSDIGIPVLENINKALSLKLGGDPGTHNIDRVLRIPGTFNFKSPDNPRPVTLISNTHKRYAFEDFQSFIETLAMDQKRLKVPGAKPIRQEDPSIVPLIDIDQLPVSDRIKFLITNGKDETYVSRSEADMAVISALVNKGVSETDIRQIFMTQQIGEKYRSHPSPDAYLKHTIEEARKRSDLTEEEMIDPLFISGSITKHNNKYSLNILNFQEYMVNKYQIIILNQERAMFRYDEKCYEQFTEKALNHLCQNELKGHRNLFGRSSLSEFIHYAIGDTLVDSETVKNIQLNFLTMQNGLYKIDEGILIDHTPKIFTTNLLPFEYDPEATCPRFMQFLNEVFLSDQDKINFVQEAVGYIFHKSIPTPAVFFLIGAGSNGKSVFINTISNLVGKENTSNVSFNRKV